MQAVPHSRLECQDINLEWVLPQAGPTRHLMPFNQQVAVLCHCHAWPMHACDSLSQCDMAFR